MILDAGYLVAFDRGEERARSFATALRRRGGRFHTSHPVLAQVWRSGDRQARLAAVSRGFVAHPLDDGRAVGHLLGLTGSADVVDAHLVLLGAQLDEPILTSDPEDLRRLAEALGPAAPRIEAW
ncbi:MAG: hypothetical protein RIE08_12580 [Acidimicrobiales bacterium]